jgi:alkylation response protein AidB-like acyl-CoA dehydrogenase
MSETTQKIRTPDDPLLSMLADQLSELAKSLDRPPGEDRPAGDTQPWPHEQLRLAGEYGINHWFVPTELGGFGWGSREIVEGYLSLSRSCLTTTFIITQRAAAIRRIVASQNIELRDELLTGILSAGSAATVGISHLTTSRRHLGKPVLSALETSRGFELNGYSPWVTGAIGAETLVIGAHLADGQQILFAIPKNTPGITIEPGFQLVALTASQTGSVGFANVQVDRKCWLNGPADDVLTTGSVSATGSFQTSALALGLASAAIGYLKTESLRRPEMNENVESLEMQLAIAIRSLKELAGGNPNCTSESLRITANGLVLRSTQAAMVAAKGAGYVIGHPVGRWCREALFFLVWSCPQAVANANLCELAGLADR